MNNSNSNDLKIATKINQSDIVKVKTGQKAILTTTAYPGEEFAGTVTFISPEVATEEGVNAYPAEISISNLDNKLKTGMIMNIAIELSKRENVLFVPVTAIQSDGGADRSMSPPILPIRLSLNLSLSSWDSTLQTA